MRHFGDLTGGFYQQTNRHHVRLKEADLRGELVNSMLLADGLDAGAELAQVVTGYAGKEVVHILELQTSMEPVHPPVVVDGQGRLELSVNPTIINTVLVVPTSKRSLAGVSDCLSLQREAPDQFYSQSTSSRSSSSLSDSSPYIGSTVALICSGSRNLSVIEATTGR